MADDYYSVLGLTQSASADEIAEAYHRSALKWHPDNNVNEREEAKNKFKKICEAYTVLSDEKKRFAYDENKKKSPESDKLNTSNNHQDFQLSVSNPKDSSDFFGDEQDFSVSSSPGAGTASTSQQVFVDSNTNNPGTTVIQTTKSSGNNSTSSSVQIKNGVKKEVRKDCVDGVETVTVLENGIIKSKTVNGVDQPLDEIAESKNPQTGNASGVTSTSVSVQVANKKEMEVRKENVGGVETVTILENGVIKSKTVNGVEQPLKE